MLCQSPISNRCLPTFAWLEGRDITADFAATIAMMGLEVDDELGQPVPPESLVEATPPVILQTSRLPEPSYLTSVGAMLASNQPGLLNFQRKAAGKKARRRRPCILVRTSPTSHWKEWGLNPLKDALQKVLHISIRKSTHDFECGF